MVRASKSSVPAPAAPVPAVVETPVAAPAEAPKAKKASSKAKKAAEPVAAVEAPAPAPVVVETPAATVEETPAVAEGEVDKNSLAATLLSEVAEFNKNYQTWVTLGASLKNNVKNIVKISARVSKNAEKSSKKRGKNTKGKPSGFEKPTLISDELAAFFGKPVGTRMARTEVSSEIHNYVKSQNLQNPANRRQINPDPKLKGLLKVTDDALTYFNLQKFLKFHFKKEAPTATA
jgi:chromatin remodeling complex protein RSC6